MLDRVGDPELDAIADNGGATLTHRILRESLAVDQGVSRVPRPTSAASRVRRTTSATSARSSTRASRRTSTTCRRTPTTTRARGRTRSRRSRSRSRDGRQDGNGRGPPVRVPARRARPDRAGGADRAVGADPAGAPVAALREPVGGADVRGGFFTFEVRAIDRAGNIDPTPDIQARSPERTRASGDDHPRAAAKPELQPHGHLQLHGDGQPHAAQFMEYECRIDTRDPDLWLECFNPAIFSNLTTGRHTVEVRATTGTRTSIRHRPGTRGWSPSRRTATPRTSH